MILLVKDIPWRQRSWLTDARSFDRRGYYGAPKSCWPCVRSMKYKVNMRNGRCLIYCAKNRQQSGHSSINERLYCLCRVIWKHQFAGHGSDKALLTTLSQRTLVYAQRMSNRGMYCHITHMIDNGQINDFWEAVYVSPLFYLTRHKLADIEVDTANVLRSK